MRHSDSLPEMETVLMVGEKNLLSMSAPLFLLLEEGGVSLGELSSEHRELTELQRATDRPTQP